MNHILTSLFLSFILFACSPSSKQNNTDETDPPATTTGLPDSVEGMTPDVGDAEGNRLAGRNGSSDVTPNDGVNNDPGKSDHGIAGPGQTDGSSTSSGNEPLSIKALLGRINPANDENFVRIESKYTSKSGIYMRKEAYESFKEMHAAAKADGINLTIVSATRTFGAQKGIWERKWTGVTRVGGKNLATSTPDHVERAKAILTYSSMPGTSRHHWGTDIDLNNLNNEWFESGTGKKVYNWLTLNAGDYGFCQTYTAIGEDRPHGYLEERWHWSYTPLSSQFLKDYEAQVKHSDIEGFKGSEVAGDINVIEHYVSGVNPACKH